MLKFILLAFILCGVYLVFLFSEKKKMHALEKSLTPLVDELSTLDKVVEGQLNTFKDTQKKIENLLTAKGPDFELTSQKIEALNRKIEAQCLAKKRNWIGQLTINCQILWSLLGMNGRIFILPLWTRLWLYSILNRYPPWVIQELYFTLNTPTEMS